MNTQVQSDEQPPSVDDVVKDVGEICNLISEISGEFPSPKAEAISAITGIFGFWLTDPEEPSWESIHKAIEDMIKKALEGEARQNVLNMIKQMEEALDISLRRLNAPCLRGGWNPKDDDNLRRETARVVHYLSFSRLLENCKNRSNEIFRIANESRFVGLPYIDRFVLTYTVAALGKLLLSGSRDPEYELLEFRMLNEQACDFYKAITPNNGDLWNQRIGAPEAGNHGWLEGTPNFSKIKRNNSGFTMWIMDEYDGAGNHRNPSKTENPDQWDPSNSDDRIHCKYTYHFLCHRVMARYLMYTCLIPMERFKKFYDKIHEKGILPASPTLYNTVVDAVKSQGHSQRSHANSLKSHGNPERKILHKGCGVKDPLDLMEPTDLDQLHINPSTRNWEFYLDTKNKGHKPPA